MDTTFTATTTDPPALSISCAPPGNGQAANNNNNGNSNGNANSASPSSEKFHPMIPTITPSPDKYPLVFVSSYQCANSLFFSVAPTVLKACLVA